MPITPPDGPGVATTGATNTECICFVHTHDRGPSNPSQRIDLSPYITSVTVSQHISGGGGANISLPAVDYIEDIIAAGDIINIYFNIHRGDSDLYNRGLVRTFFGYVESVSRSVSVGGIGEKITTYSLMCKDFSKAVRDTEIYNNENLIMQSRGGKSGVIRKDLSTNLGGIALLSRGIAMQGTPRQIVLQNLMRFLGFGGQWALPSSYSERLPDSSANIEIVRGAGKDSAANTLQGALESIKDNEDVGVKKKFAEVMLKLAKEALNKNKTVNSLWDSVTLIPGTDHVGKGQVSEGLAAEIRQLKSNYKYLEYKLNTNKRSEGYINNTYFRVRGVSQGKIRRSSVSYPDSEVSSAEQGLEDDLKIVTERVLNEVESTNPDVINEFGVAPLANQYAQGFSESSVAAKSKTPVKTIFNILGLDYLEKCSGYWADFQAIHFQGSLMSALETGANVTMNELFFDLRPSPLFTPLRKDGLGTPLAGAIPMVPCVILRRKPFTNYPMPGKQIQDDQIDGNIVLGGFEATNQSTGESYFSDQMVVNSGGALGAYGASPISASEENSNKFKGSIEQVGSKATVDGSVTIPLKKVAAPGGPGARTSVPTNSKGSAREPSDAQKEYLEKVDEALVKLGQTGINNNSELVTMYNLSTAAPVDPVEAASEYIGVTVGAAQYLAARRAFSTFITLPRPVFRSPDSNRITKELDISYSQHLVGVMTQQDGKSSTKFYAFGTSSGGVSAVGAGISEDSVGVPADNYIGDSAAVESGSSMYDINNRLNEAQNQLKGAGGVDEEAANSTDWHVLDYLTVRAKDCMSETYTRGDFGVVNFNEYWGNALGGAEAQRLFMGTVMPIVTPISVYRFGVRVLTQSTDHVQALLTGGVDHDHQKNILLRWVILQDMWNQHNHELLAGTMNLRGFPGLRVGYRIDRPEINLSFYVDRVSHSWTHPGGLRTQVGVSRGQPMSADAALKYYRPRPDEDPATVDRQELGKVFKTSEFRMDGTSYKLNTPGTFTGSSDVGRQITVETRNVTPDEEEISR